ncbi:hypothetical protein PHAVU_010G134400 [Phaseolus vulgaris]|uniref:Hydroxyproline-rich glycoprotein family protein n=1 Tax=Phaseolus vulgaris TaxID=3885 RepID=V7AQ94_PHAVU|nr:hypothetical protein PHAVU_010G134400g [Phaseolus vulgaris]ESW07495.1 hypothetical protein PHAVU_010G134400g [Phaseolus vulgaris]
MEQEGDTFTMPPFWAAENRDRRLFRRSYSLLRTSTSLFVLFLVLALVFSLIVVPTLHSFASNIFKPRTVKNSWDSLNLVLVLFAIVCGFLSRNTTSETPTSSRRTFSNPSTPPPTWYQYDYSHSHTPRRSFNRLRSFNSYPDLRQPIAADERFRFYDDTYLLQHRHPSNEAEEEEKEIGIENVVTAPPPQQGTQTVRRNVQRACQVETVEKHETDDVDAKILPPPPAIKTQVVRRSVKRLQRSETVEKHETDDSAVEKISLSPPSTPPPATRTQDVRRKAKRTYQAETIEKLELNDLDSQSSQPSPSPLMIRTKGVQRNAKPERDNSFVKSEPPPPPPPPQHPAEAKTAQGKKKRGTPTIEFWTSLRGKKKKLRQRSVENFDSIFNSEALLAQPPAPPPPPPPKVFQNLFSLKKAKHKTPHSVSVAITRVSNKREPGSSSSSTLKDKVMMAGNESPLNPIPPPPPLPPFKLPGWKFRVQGDYVRVDSTGSSRSGSPDLDEVSVDTPTTHDETSKVNPPFAKDGEDSASVSAPSLFCPSPDVDTKAHNFIESFRAGLRMAKMNSMNERHGIRRSNLGPSPPHEW